jgi:8-amino-7-oxononanoate synthase
MDLSDACRVLTKKPTFGSTCCSKHCVSLPRGEAVNDSAIDLDQRHWTGINDHDIFRKAYRFDQQEKLESAGVCPFFLPMQDNEGPISWFDGRPVIMLGANNYLGLTVHPEVRTAAAEAAHRWGTSCTGSRILSGTLHLHERLEARLAEFVGKEKALIFTTGYQTSIGILTALASNTDLIVLDRFAHASLNDGASLCRGEKARFKHNDAEDLERILAVKRKNGGCLVVAEGVYSMGGDLGDLPALSRAAKQAGARLLIDDAHGIGVLGANGRGTADHLDISRDIDLIMGTFSKALASIGGFVAGPAGVIDFIRYFGRSMLFSTSLPPACLAAADAALTLLLREPEIVDRVQRNAASWRNGLRDRALDVPEGISPIVPIAIGPAEKALRMWRLLLDRGVYVNPVVYPAVPHDGAILRTSVMATHEESQLEQALEAMIAVKQEVDAI